MIIYLDNCCYNRSLDDQTQERRKGLKSGLQKLCQSQRYGHLTAFTLHLQKRLMQTYF